MAVWLSVQRFDRRLNEGDEVKFIDGIFLGIGIGVLFMLFALAVCDVEMAGTNGYCAALNGEAITYNVCNVDGRVVQVR